MCEKCLRSPCFKFFGTRNLKSYERAGLVNILIQQKKNTL